MLRDRSSLWDLLFEFLAGAGVWGRDAKVLAQMAAEARAEAAIVKYRMEAAKAAKEETALLKGRSVSLPK